MRRLGSWLAAGSMLVGTGCFSITGKKDAELVSSAAAAKPDSSIDTRTDIPTKDAAELAMKMGESIEATGKELDAIRHFERARALDPSLNDRAARRLAVLYDKLDEQAKAMTEFQALLKKYPKDTSLLSDVGFSYYNRGQWAEAETYFRKAIAQDKTYKRAWVNLGMTLAQQGRYPESLEAFSQGVSQAEAYSNMAFIMTAQKKYDEAKQAYRKALELEPALRVAQQSLAKLEKPPVPDAGGVTPAAGATPTAVGVTEPKAITTNMP